MKVEITENKQLSPIGFYNFLDFDKFCIMAFHKISSCIPIEHSIFLA